MLSHVLLSGCGLAALAAGQSLNFDQIAAAPPVVVAVPAVLGSEQTVPIQPSAVASSVGAAAVETGAATTATSRLRRSANAVAPLLSKRDGDCAVQPAGTGPAIHFPDDSPKSFEDSPIFPLAAETAPVPTGYEPAFINLNASTSTSAYLGYTTLSAYDPKDCAARCTAIDGCQAFNLYFERDPTLDPNEDSCSDPASLTNIKCAFWGVPISAATATNDGQFRDCFQVVIAGSNGYNAIPDPDCVPGYTPPSQWPGAPDCPNDPTGGYSTFVGSIYVSFGIEVGQVQSFNAEVCTSACSAQSALHPDQACNQVVASLLVDAHHVPQGVRCALYSESWDASFGTIVSAEASASLGGGLWTVASSLAYTNEIYAAAYADIKVGGYQGGNCGGRGAGKC